MSFVLKALKSKFFFLIVNSVIIIAVFNWLHTHILLPKFFAQITLISTKAVVGVLLLNIVLLYIYGVRLSQLLWTQKYFGFATVVIGFGMNCILPFRLGELAKFAYAKQLFNISASRLAASAVSEKMLDLLAILSIGLFSSQTFVGNYFNRLLMIAGIFFATLIFTFIVAIRWERSGRKLHLWISDAFDILLMRRNPFFMMRLFFLTIAIYAITVFSIYWMFNSNFPEFSVENACSVLLILALAVAIPSTPASIGVVEVSVVLYLQHSLQVEANRALACVFVFHILTIIPQVVGAATILSLASFRQNIMKKF
jgi:glycosyltransferase 2 family protein